MYNAVLYSAILTQTCVCAHDHTDSVRLYHARLGGMQKIVGRAVIHSKPFEPTWVHASC